MKIVDVRAHLIHAPIPPDRRVESGAGVKLARQMCLVEVVTEDGLIGIGSPSGPYELGVLASMIENALKPRLLGLDARDTERIWQLLYRGDVSRNSGHRSVGIAAMSAIDIALWDLKGKRLGVPVYELLGGRYHDAGVRAYASSIYWDLAPEEAANEAVRWVDAGFTAVKLKVGRSLSADAANIAAIREAIGSNVELLTDGNQALDRIGANTLLGVMEEFGCYWFEEPLNIDDIAGHRMLRGQRRTVRIAAGENLYGRWSFADYVIAEALDVLQADVSRAGGISEVRRIADLAAAFHLAWNPHTFNDIVTVVANLHLVTASAQPAMFEWDVTYNPLMDELADWKLTIESGLIHAPDRPGLGLEIDMDFVSGHAWNGEASIGLGHGGVPNAS